jgi:hypothetical protein
LHRNYITYFSCVIKTTFDATHLRTFAAFALPSQGIVQFLEDSSWFYLCDFASLREILFWLRLRRAASLREIFSGFTANLALDSGRQQQQCPGQLAGAFQFVT